MARVQHVFRGGRQCAVLLAMVSALVWGPACGGDEDRAGLDSDSLNGPDGGPDTSDTGDPGDIDDVDPIDDIEEAETSSDTGGDTAAETSAEVDVDPGETVATREVSLTLTLPPETPRAARLEVEVRDLRGTRRERLDVTGRTLTASIDTAGEATFSLSMVEPEAWVPVAASGADQQLGRVVVTGSEAALEVFRWGRVGDTAQVAWVPLVSVPAFTPEGPIHVSGNQVVLGDWDGVGLALWPAIEGRHAAMVAVLANTTLEYKVTRGSWDTVEKGIGGVEIPNRTATISGPILRSTISVETWRDATGPPISGPRLVHVPSFASDNLTPRRDLWIYLPPGYDSAPERRYPVLYMHDGQNLFDGSLAAFGVAWEVDAAADAGILAGLVEPLIIVGIESTEDRMSEYTPVVDDDYGGGNAAAYGRFLVEELKPYIDAQYRTRVGPDDTGLAGSSLGGLVSLYLGLEYPGVFRRLGVVSPSVWWADKDIVGRVSALGAKLPLFIWLDIGTAEGSGTAVGNTRQLRDALVSRGWGLDVDLVYREYNGAQHNEGSWAERFPEILRALFPASR